VETPFNERLAFTYFNRDDLIGGYKLDRVECFTNGVKTKTVKLAYDYFHSDTKDAYSHQWFRLDRFPNYASGSSSSRKLNFYGNYVGGSYNFSAATTDLRLKLLSVTDLGDGTTSLPPYSFSYDESKNLPRKTSLSVDHWGYANFTRNETLTPILGNPDGSSGANRSPDPTLDNLWALSRITYPLGGETAFTYEMNEIDPSQSSVGFFGGGYRVRSTIDYTGGVAAKSKYYSYFQDPEATVLQSSGKLFSYPSYNWVQPRYRENCMSISVGAGEGPYSFDSYTNVLRSTSSSSHPLSSSFFGSFVGYSTVTVSDRPEFTALGRTTSTYHNNLYPYFTNNVGGYEGIVWPKHFDLMNGKLLTQRQYDNQSLLKLETTYDYTTEAYLPPHWNWMAFMPFSVENGCHSGGYYAGDSPELCILSASFGFMHMAAYNDEFIRIQLNSVTSKTMDEGGTSETVASYEYVPGTMFKRSETQSGPLASKTTSYFYPGDVAGYSHLLNANMVGVPVKIIDPSGIESTIAYDPTWLVPSKVTQKFTDNSSLVASKVISFFSGGYPNKVESFNLPNPTTYTWDEGQVTSSTYLNHKQQFFYDSRRRLDYTTAINGQKTYYTYDGLDRLTEAKSRDGNITQTTSYSIGGGANSVSSTTTFADAPANSTSSTFDGLGRALQTVVNGVVSSKQEYDAYGRAFKSLYMPGYGDVITTYENSPLSRPLSTTYPDGSQVSTAYAVEDGAPITLITDEKGNVSKVQKDIFGRTAKTVDAQGGATIYDYTQFDAPQTVSPPSGGSYSYSYFPRGNLLATKTIPGGITTTYNYDNRHNLKSTTLPNGTVISVAYDKYNREKATTDQLGPAGNWSTPYGSLSSPLTTTTYNPDIIGNSKTGTIDKSTAALLLPNGTTGSAVTTEFKEYDNFGRSHAYNERYTIDGQTQTAKHTFKLNHRDLTEESTLINGAASLTQSFSFDDFSRPTSAATGLNYSLAIENNSTNIQVAMKYNTAGQMTERRLMDAQRGFYGEKMSYGGRGWLTAINNPVGRSFDALICAEPEGDVYEPECNNEEIGLVDLFQNLAEGSKVEIPELICDDTKPPTGCTKPTTVRSYTVGIPNPIKFRKGEFVNAAGIPCPNGGNCSSLARTNALQEVTDIKVTGIVVLNKNEETVLPLPYNYSLNDPLLLSQQQGANKVEFNRLKNDALNVAERAKVYMDRVTFAVQSDPTDCIHCETDGKKNYNVEMTFENSTLEIKGVEVAYTYRTAEKKTGNFTWRLGVQSSRLREKLVPCNIKIDSKPFPIKEGGKKLENEDKPKTSPNLVVASNPLHVQLLNDVFQSAKSVRTITVRSLAVSAADELTIQDRKQEACTTAPKLEEQSGAGGDKANATASADNAIAPRTTLGITEILARRRENKEAVKIVLPGKPYGFRQGEELTQEERTTNKKEKQKLLENLNRWFTENGYPKTKGVIGIGDDGTLHLAVTGTALELIHAVVQNEYLVPVVCPDGSEEQVVVKGESHRVGALARSETDFKRKFFPRISGFKQLPVLPIPGGGIDKPQKNGFDKDVVNCVNTPPSCTDEQTRQQLAFINDFYDGVDIGVIASYLPTNLHRVILCDGTVAFLPEQLLNQLPGSYTSTGSTPINSPYETFNAEVGAGANALFSLSLDYEPNGNIREASWKTTYHAPNTYVYEYDDLNRLTGADYSTASGGGGMFSVAGISYDGIGNILSLNRKGVTACNDDGEAQAASSPQSPTKPPTPT